MKNRKSIFWGLLLITVGVLWFLDNMGMVSISITRIISDYWPIIFIAWGADLLVEAAQFKGSPPLGRFVNSALLLAVGALLLGNTLGFYSLDLSVLWKAFWPAIIIIIGFNIILGGRSKAGGSYFAVMSGLENKNPGWKMESGSYTAFMGGVDLDLTVADIPDGTVYLSLLAVMGGVNLKIPADLEVECSTTAMLGGVSLMKDSSGGIFGHKRMHKPGSSGKKLIINASAILGGIEIK